ncbi:MAG: alginate export family protein, partial [Planctomycetota bacterium]
RIWSMPDFLRTLVAIAVLGCAAGAQEAAQLRVGNWVHAKGELSSAGVFVAKEVEVVQPENGESLTGTIESADSDGFTLLGARIEFDARTVFEGVVHDALAGKRVKVSGRLRPGGRFQAKRVAARATGRDRVEGRIDAIESGEQSLDLRVQGFRVRVALSSKLELAFPLDSLRLAPAPDLLSDAPQRDEDDRVRGSIHLGEDWVLGGLVEWNGENRGNFDLDSSRARDRYENQLSFRTELVWTPNESSLFLASYEHLEDWREEQHKPSLHSGVGQFKQAYGFFRDVALGWDVQVGRAVYHEPRRWIWNANLDGVRLLKNWAGLRFDLSLTTRFIDGSQRDQDTTNVMAYVSGGTPKRGWGLWALDRDNRELADEETRHFGARLFGEWLPGFNVWAEGALLRGDQQGERASAEAFDVGSVWSPTFLGPLHLVGGYAFGSGDDSALDQHSSTFHQTGLHDNKGKLDSATSLHYYGELVDPELANLGILTLGVGLHLEKRTTLTLLAHQYTLDHAQDALYGSNLRTSPDGVHPQIGWEYDLVLGTKRWENWQVELVFGAFDPGAAFPGGSSAYLGAVQVKYGF